MIWVGVWIVLLLLAALVLVPLGRSVYRRSRALFDEAGAAGERFAAVGEGLQHVAQQRDEFDLAVFADPAQLRREHSPRGGGRHRADAPLAPRGRTTSADSTYDGG